MIVILVSSIFISVRTDLSSNGKTFHSASKFTVKSSMPIIREDLLLSYTSGNVLGFPKTNTRSNKILQ